MKKLGIVLMIMALVMGNYYQHHYTRKNCEVIQINDGYATFEDECGYIWDAECKDLKVGDIVDLKMKTIDSRYFENDEIIKVIKK